MIAFLIMMIQLVLLLMMMMVVTMMMMMMVMATVMMMVIIIMILVVNMREPEGLGLNHKCESGPRKVCILPSRAPTSHDDESSHKFPPKKVSISYQHDHL